METSKPQKRSEKPDLPRKSLRCGLTPAGMRSWGVDGIASPVRALWWGRWEKHLVFGYSAQGVKLARNYVKF